MTHDPKTTLPLHPDNPEPQAQPPAKAPAAPMNARATQMSPSAVPSTLESPMGASSPPAAVSAPAPSLDEISGMEVSGIMLDGTERAATAESGRRTGGPRTLASPAAMGPIGIAQAEGGTNPPPPPAVIDVGAPAHAYLPSAPPAHGAREPLGSSPGLGSGPPPGMPGMGPPMGQGFGGAPGQHGGHATHAQHGGQAPARTGTSSSMMALIIGAVVVGLVVIVGAIGGFVYFTHRRSADRDRDPDQPTATRPTLPGLPSLPKLPGAGGAAGAAPDSSAATERTAPPAETTRTPMGGSKARLTGLVARSLDLQKARNAVAAGAPRIDACFAAAELVPPNHETAGYDLDVAASGEVTRADPTTQIGRCAQLDACMAQSLRALRMPRSPTGSTVKLTFTAKIP